MVFGLFDFSCSSVLADGVLSVVAGSVVAVAVAVAVAVVAAAGLSRRVFSIFFVCCLLQCQVYMYVFLRIMRKQVQLDA